MVTLYIPKFNLLAVSHTSVSLNPHLVLKRIYLDGTALILLFAVNERAL